MIPNYRILKLLAAAIFLMLTCWASAQNALKLEWVLSGPAIRGMVPSGRAVLNQPSLPGQLTAEVKNVNLPDGTVLSFSLGGYAAGTMTLRGRGAKLQASIPFQFRNGPVEVVFGPTLIMSGRFKI